MDPSGLGRVVIAIGLLVVVVGVLLAIGAPVGRLPGDIAFRGEHWSFFFPLGTSILIGVVLSLVLALVSALGRR